MIRPIWILARQTWLEAWHARLPAMLVVVCAIGLGLQWFIGAVTLIEHDQASLAIAAPALRLSVVALMAALLATMLGREFGERRIELLLAAPIGRLTWIAGRFAGVAMIATVCALAAGVAIGWQAPVAGTLLWAATFWLELVLVGALTVTVTVALRRPAVSLLAVMLLYVAARVMPVIDRLAQSDIPALGEGGFAGALTGLLARIVPQAYLFAPTEYLLNGDALDAGAPQFTAALAQFVIYLALLLMVCHRDLSDDLD